VTEDFDLDRVITDPAYRRRVIARLNEPPAEPSEEAAAPSPAQLLLPQAKFRAAD
jgi:hypothetical protein